MEPNFEPPVLLVVAHWDDEVIHAGGALIKHGKDWHVLSVTFRSHELEHEKVFKTVCKIVGAIPFTLPISHRAVEFKDVNFSRKEYVKKVPLTKLTVPLITKYVKGIIDFEKYRTIITHGFDGDINEHIQHKQISNIASVLFYPYMDNTVYRFSWNKETACRVEMTEEEYEAKWNLIKMYKPRERRFIPRFECFEYY